MIYTMLMVGMLSIRISPLSSGSNYLDSTINDVAIGAFASTLVALLIDKANCELKNAKNKKRLNIHGKLHQTIAQK